MFLYVQVGNQVYPNTPPLNRVTAVGVQQVQTPPASTAATSATGGAAAALSPWLQQYVRAGQAASTAPNSTGARTTTSHATTTAATGSASPWLQQYVIPRVNPVPATSAPAATAPNPNSVQGAVPASRPNRATNHVPSRGATATQSRATTSTTGSQNRSHPQATANPFARRTNTAQPIDQGRRIPQSHHQTWGTGQQGHVVTAAWNTGVRISVTAQGQTYGHTHTQAQASTHSSRGSSSRDPRLAATTQRNQAQVRGGPQGRQRRR